jgi:hypothetical protein
MAYITTESGDLIVQESVTGLPGASSLNDAKVQIITKEDFSIDPTTRGWFVGVEWTWDSSAHNMKI